MSNLPQKKFRSGLGRRLFAFWLAVTVSMLLALSLPTGSVLAGPVFPGRLHFTQPNGTIITACASAADASRRERRHLSPLPFQIAE